MCFVPWDDGCIYISLRHKWCAFEFWLFNALNIVYFVVYAHIGHYGKKFTDYTNCGREAVKRQLQCLVVLYGKLFDGKRHVEADCRWRRVSAIMRRKSIQGGKESIQDMDQKIKEGATLDIHMHFRIIDSTHLKGKHTKRCMGHNSKDVWYKYRSQEDSTQAKAAWCLER